MSTPQVGDVVARSGGPPITVEEIIEKREDGVTVKCVWFDGLGNLHKDWFFASELRQAPYRMVHHLEVRR